MEHLFEPYKKGIYSGLQPQRIKCENQTTGLCG